MIAASLIETLIIILLFIYIYHLDGELTAARYDLEEANGKFEEQSTLTNFLATQIMETVRLREYEATVVAKNQCERCYWNSTCLQKNKGCANFLYFANEEQIGEYKEND